MKRLIAVALLVGVVGASFMGRGYGADPTTAPAAGTRAPAEIIKDLQAVSAELKDKVGPMTVLFDAEKRKTSGATAIPLLKKLNGLMADLVRAEPKYGPSVAEERGTMNALLVLLGDADTVKAVDEAAKGTGPAALDAQLSQQTAAWWGSKADAAAQGKVLETMTTLAKANPDSDAVAMALMSMASMNAANEDMANSARDVIVTKLTGDAAKQMKSEIQADQKLAANVGKPLVISGKTPGGEAFSTADWKGKVVLVDFWATWCGPCLAELPRVKKAYKDFHGKGLEIVGVSNDYAAEDLTKFVAADPDMGWPNVFDADAAKEHNWNPITTGFGINGIPTMFLIDKKGILRSVTARENFEDVIPKLLEEK